MASSESSSPRHSSDEEARRRWEDRPAEPVADASPRPDWERGFSLAQLFALFLVVSVLLAVIRCFSPQIAAGVAGLAVLIGLVVMSIGDPPAIVRLTWWTLLAIYLAAAGIAVVRG